MFKALHRKIEFLHKGAMVSSKLELWTIFFTSLHAFYPHRSRPYFKPIYSKNRTMRNVLKGRSNTLHLCSLMLNPLDLQHFRDKYCIVTCNFIVKLFCWFFLYSTVTSFTSMEKECLLTLHTPICAFISSNLGFYNMSNSITNKHTLLLVWVGNKNPQQAIKSINCIISKRLYIFPAGVMISLLQQINL